ncbi:hypothetical protein GCM10007938_34780 [Vibrio zhanjiangensis]|uniref:Uncharacterized protein n=1 Tax=Vibrio zhanjiangensis TaxID=1046128 RepID=A0ABQ6F4C4_9VIBR|nr:hypothetical protein [Vibrio zhanjiangensis]GLT19695.1 hypothetical protein GCM10007938_34780 [Vibrio zhanjiangensis]
MIKKFYSEQSNLQSKTALTETDKGSRSVIKQFGHVQPTKKLLSESESRQDKQSNNIDNSVTKKMPSVLFSKKISTMQTDLVTVDESIKSKIDEVCAREFKDLALINSDYFIITNHYESIRFHDPSFQIEFGSDESKRFQELQGFLSDYAKLSKVDRILDLGKIIIKIAKSIDIDIFNPRKIGTKLSKILGTRNAQVRRIKHEFDNASDGIDLRINRVFDNLSEMKSNLEKFQAWNRDLQSLNKNLQFKMIALRLKINDEESLSLANNNDSPNIFHRSDNESTKRWERKMQTLFSLNQSINLTFPQIDLYSSNLISSFERFEKIKVDIIQVWKQQFLTVIAVDESNDSMLYFELNDIQDQLIRNIEELR